MLGADVGIVIICSIVVCFKRVLSFCLVCFECVLSFFVLYLGCEVLL